MRFYYGDKVKLNSIHRITEKDGRISCIIPEGTQGIILSTDPDVPIAYISFDFAETRGRNIPVPYTNIEKINAQKPLLALDSNSK